MHAGVAAVLTLAVSTACTSSNGGTTPSPSASRTVSPSAATPSADIQVILDRAVRDYYAQANIALATGNVAGLVLRSTEKCSCRRLVEYIEEKYKAGSLRGAEFRLRSVRPYDVQATRAVVQVTHDAPAYEVLDKSGRVVDVVEADPSNREDLFLVHQDGHWLVDNVVTL